MVIDTDIHGYTRMKHLQQAELCIVVNIIMSIINEIFFQYWI